MFVHHCTACDQRQLIFPSQISGVAEVDGQSGFAFTCWCGQPQVWAVGRAIDAPAELRVAA